MNSPLLVRTGIALTCALAVPAAARAGGLIISANSALVAPAIETMQGGAVMTMADVQRLQDNVYDLGGEISRLRSRDASLANRLDDELNDLRDEAIYLKVKLRKEGNVSRGEYADLRDRLDNLRSRARGDSSPQSGGGSAASRPAPAIDPPMSPSAPPADYRPSPAADVPPPPPPQDSSRRARREHEIPVGQEVDVRLQSRLSSATAQVEDRFEATTLVDLLEGDRLMVPAGSVMRGVVQAVNKAGRLDRKGSMTLSFDEITVRGRTYPIRATVTQAIESEGVRGEAGKLGTAAGVGAIIGGILGGFKGALAGILIGGGGTIAATEGKDVALDAGTVLRVRFDSPVVVDNASSNR